MGIWCVGRDKKKVLGTYQHVETTNPEVILKMIKQDINEKYVAALKNPNAHLTIEVSGDDYVLSSAIDDWWKRETRFTLGKGFYENLSDRDRGIITTVYKEDDKLVFKFSGGEQNVEKRYAFTNDGVTVIFNVENILARRVYKRV